jgi:hypothetical protein
MMFSPTCFALSLSSLYTPQKAIFVLPMIFISSVHPISCNALYDILHLTVMPDVLLAAHSNAAIRSPVLAPFLVASLLPKTITHHWSYLNMISRVFNCCLC